MTSARNGNIMVFRPSEDEFRDFSGYVKHMERAGAHAASIVKVIPPASWHARRTYDMDVLGQMMINSPIMQLINGRQGIYQLTNVLKKPLTVKDFRDLATSERFKPPEDAEAGEVERKFWRSLAFNAPIYGADVPGSIYDADVKTWNVGGLDTILDLLQSEFDVKIPGVNTPYLYFGMWRAMFPWHVEDMDLYSINYLHFGAPKSWYAIPMEQGQRFESLASGFFSDSSQQCSQFLRHKITLLSPSVLDKYCIPYNKITQNAGEFIITFPHGYHSGFNHGFNCAESTNFASERWIDYGVEAKVCSCTEDAVKINMAPFLEKYRPEQYKVFMKSDKYVDDAMPNKARTGKMAPSSKIQTVKQKRSLLPAVSPSKNGVMRKKQGGDLQALFATLLDNNTVQSVKVLRAYNALLAKATASRCAICSAFSRPQRGRSTGHGRSITDDDASGEGEPLPVTSELCYAWSSGEPSIVAALQETKPPSAALCQCASCAVMVHAGCYCSAGEDRPTAEWRCDMCRSHAESSVAFRKVSCALCHVGGGAMKGTVCGQWVHVVCAIANPMVRFGCVPSRSDIDISDTRDNATQPAMSCCYCLQHGESATPCSAPFCRQVMHANCSVSSGVPIAQQEWPFAVKMSCPGHWKKTQQHKAMQDVRTRLSVDDKVIAKHKNNRYYRGTVRRVEDTFYYRVIFDDGSYCKDLPPDNVKASNESASLPRTIPIGDPVSVDWTDGLVYNARITGHTTAVRLQIHFEDDSMLFVKEADVYSQHGRVPDKVAARLSSASFVKSPENDSRDGVATKSKRARIPNSRYGQDFVT